MRKLLLALLFCLLPIYTQAAMTFNGVNGTINYGDVNALDNTSFTLNAWINPTTLKAWCAPISKRAGANGFDMMINGTDTNDVMAILRNGGTTNEKGSTSANILTANVTGMWTMVYNSAGAANADRLKFYFNGVEKTLAYQDTISTTPPNTAYNLTLAFQVGDGSYLDCVITEFAAWNTTLTAAEITTLYNSGNPIKGTPLNIEPANLVIYSGIVDGVNGVSANGVTVVDTSGKNNNGVASGGVTWSTDIPPFNASNFNKNYISE